MPFQSLKHLARSVFVPLAVMALLNGSAQARELRKIIFGSPNATITSSYCMFPTALALGFFADEGIDLTMQPVAGTAPLYQTILSGRIDFAGATPEPIFQFYGKGDEQLVDVYNFIRRPTGSIAVLDESPIKSLDDFRGKKLGAMSLASSNITLTNGVLSRAGLNPKNDVSYLPVGVGAQALQSLRSKMVDGLVLSDQYYVEMEQSGTKLRYFEGPDQARLYSTQIMVKRSFLEKEPDIIRGFGRALAKGTYIAQQNPEACIKIMWATIPSTRRTGVPDADQLRIDLAILTARMKLLVTPASTAHGWGWYDADDVEAWNEFASASGIIPSKVNTTKIYTNQFVDDYNRFNKEEVLKKAREWKR